MHASVAVRSEIMSASIWTAEKKTLFKLCGKETFNNRQANPSLDQLFTAVPHPVCIGIGNRAKMGPLIDGRALRDVSTMPHCSVIRRATPPKKWHGGNILEGNFRAVSPPYQGLFFSSMTRGNNEKHEKQSEIVSFLPTRRDWEDSTRMLQSGGLGIEKYGNGEKRKAQDGL